MEQLRIKYKPLFPDYAWKEIETNFSKMPIKRLEKYIETYKHVPGATMPSLIKEVCLRERFDKMKLAEIQEYAENKGIYIVWKNGKRKTKHELINSIILYSYEPKAYLAKKSPNAPKPKASSYSRDELQNYCKKRNIKFTTKMDCGELKAVIIKYKKNRKE